MEVQAESRSQLHRLQESKGWEDNRPHVVLISGKAGVGKTTLAGLLSKVVREREDHTSIIMKQSVAWGVKQTAVQMGWDHEKDAAGRRLLQGIGKIGRAYDPDVWVRIACKGITDTQYHYGSVESSLRYVWVDDWRFKNEARWFKELDYMFRVRLVRVLASSREILKGTPEALDISELDLDDYTEFDIIVENEGTLEELRKTAITIYNIITNVEV